MIRNATEVPSGSELNRDTCIVGAGVAGIALALELDGGSGDVCLLESGGREVDLRTQQLYAGPAPTGFLTNHPDYLAAGRVRMLGGTTHTWAGYCRPLDPIDMRAREWVADSGWPFDRSHLEPYYQRAAPLFEIEPFDEDLSRLRRKPMELEADSGLVTSIYQRRPIHFGRTYASRLESSSTIEVLLQANVVEIVTDPAGSRVEWLEVATLGGPRFRVRARRFVIAAGGLETPRLLLASNRVQAAGLGNEHDLVGRYFMEHHYAVADIGNVFFIESTEALALYGREAEDDSLVSRHVGVLTLSDELQAEHELLNHQFRIHPWPESTGGNRLDRAVASVTQDLGRAGGGVAPVEGAAHMATLEVGFELPPRASNRVTLADESDELGMRRIRLHYDLTDSDREEVRRSVLVFAATLGRTLRARVKVLLDDDHPWEASHPGDHHMGTTRMHPDPKQGVVDADCRVHGVENLYVAGSSVFPTAGRPNPTFTIGALALRLADYLRRSDQR